MSTVGMAHLMVSALAVLVAVPAPAAADPLASDWAEAHGGKARLIVGSAALAGSSAPRLVAGIEVRLAPGWKTYWRSPGDSGGLPPQFDWSQSTNLASAKVLYPAPSRFKDALGDALGYSGSVIFPVELRRKDGLKPVELHLSLLYGICHEICVPAEAQLKLQVPAGATVPAHPGISAALSAVPRSSGERQPDDPELISKDAHLDGDRPKLVLEARFPNAAKSADIIIEAPEGGYVPLPVKTTTNGDTVRFVADLTQGAEPDALRGKTLRITMISGAGQSEALWTLE